MVGKQGRRRSQDAAAEQPGVIFTVYFADIRGVGRIKKLHFVFAGEFFHIIIGGSFRINAQNFGHGSSVRFFAAGLQDIDAVQRDHTDNQNTEEN